MIIQNMSGAQRTEFGTYVAASQFYLAMFTGSYGTAGGGVLDAGGVTQFMAVKPPVKSPPPPPGMPKIPVSIVGDWVANDKPNPINFWWIMTSSPVTQQPNSNAVKAAMKKVPFVVVADNLMTSTALYADLVLPVCTIFEETNLMAGIRNHYVQLMEKAVEPPGDAKSDVWIFTQLAKRLGFGQAFDKPIEQYIEACLEGTGVTLAQLKKGPVKPVPTPVIPFKEGKFRTPTGKAMAFVQGWKDKNKLSPIVTYYRPVESPKGSPKLAKKYPLMAVQRKLHRSIHSSFGTIPWLNEATGTKPQVMIHPLDAAARSIADGDKVAVYNDRGKHTAAAIVTNHVRQGVVVLENGWWEQQGGSSSHVNNDKPEPLGFGQSCNSTLVEARKEV
jgi:anaerobic selenocysteine-containing dehydrogenase